MFFRPLPVFALSLCFCLTSCSKGPARSRELLAVLPLENFSADADAAWIGRAVAGIVAARTAGNPAVRTFEAPTLRDAALHRATRSLSGYFLADAGRISLHATLRDEEERRNLDEFGAAGPAADLFGLAEALAVRTGAPLQPYTSANAAAVEALYRGLTEPDGEAAARQISKAIELDPQFGTAQVARIDLLFRSGRPADARPLLAGALRSRLTPLEKARLDLIAAEFAGDNAGRMSALARLAEMQPADTEIWTALANAQIAGRDFRGAIRSLDNVLEVNSADENALNLRAYAYAWAGDENASLRAMQEYRQRVPGSANAIDSLGEVTFYFGHFREAAKLFLEANDANPAQIAGNEPLRAAFAQYMAGDPGAADQLAANYFAGLRRRGDPLVELRSAVWRKITGRPAGNLPDVPLSRAMESLWSLAAGDRAKSAALAAKARSEAKDLGAATVANLVVLLSQPSTNEAGWRQRIGQAVPQSATQREQLVGWALLLDGQAAAAAQIWRQILAGTSAAAANEERLMLAWSLIDSGQLDEARKVMPYGFMPPASFDPSLSVLLWARSREIYQKVH